nr:hypothetical protein [Nocardia sp. CY41]
MKVLEIILVGRIWIRQVVSKPGLVLGGCKPTESSKISIEVRLVRVAAIGGDSTQDRSRLLTQLTASAIETDDARSNLRRETYLFREFSNEVLVTPPHAFGDLPDGHNPSGLHQHSPGVDDLWGCTSAAPNAIEKVAIDEVESAGPCRLVADTVHELATSNSGHSVQIDQSTG